MTTRQSTPMRWIMTLVIGLGLVGPALAQSSGRHSGLVVSVDPAGRTLTLNELVEEGRPRQLDVRVPREARIVFSERLPDEQVTRLEAPFSERSIDLGEVHPGDFVMVEGQTREGAATAAAVVVTLRAGASEAAPSAAPAPRSRP